MLRDVGCRTLSRGQLNWSLLDLAAHNSNMPSIMQSVYSLASV